jgi:hypothetical protein
VTPSNEAQKGRALQSWKEIANCLGVTVRSVQRWEKTAGLPVYRQGSGKKARVFAYAEELQAWMESGGAGREEEERAESQAPAERSHWLRTAAILVAAAAVGSGILWHTGFLVRFRTPHSWVLEGPRLRVLDSRERSYWEKRIPPLHSGYDLEAADKVLIEDIDGDGRREVLFNFIPENLGQQSGSLMCFEQDGRLRWEHRFGAVKQFGTRSFTANYAGRFVRLVSVEGRPYLLTVANHHLWYPSRTALLDPKTGGVLEEYWHPGSIRHCVVQDLDNDDASEVLLGGINNPGEGLGHPGVAVLTLPFSKARRRPAPAGGKFPPVTGGGEFAYLLFPHADMCKVMGMLPAISLFGIEQNRRIVVQTVLPEGGAIVYYLDFNLNVQEFRFSDNVVAVHDRYFLQGLLNHRLGEKERAALGKVVRFDAAPDGNSPELKRFWEF